MKIRSAQLQDVQQLAQVHVRSWQSAYKGLLPDEYLANLSVESREEQWSNAITNSPTQLDLCEDNEGIVGFVAYGRGRDNDAKTRQVGEIYAIYLDADVWGKGYGKALLDKALRILQNQGYSRVVLWVLDTNERAIKFYERNGFTLDGETKREPLSANIMVQEVRYTRSFTIEV